MVAKAERELSLDRLKEALSYDPETGQFFWLIDRSRGVKAGDEAGGIDRKSRVHYRYLNLYGRHYVCHRLAWFYTYGVWPEGAIDHANGVSTDNTISNLRLATYGENRRNSKKPRTNTSGHKGVSWCKSAKKWHVAIKKNYKNYNIGHFDDLEEAAAAYRSAAVKYHGDFARIE